MIFSCPHCNKGNRVPIEKISQNPTCGACSKELLSLPISPSEEAFHELIKQSSLPVIVDFWAPWCGPCKMFAPTFQASAIAYANKVIHLKVDTELNPSLGSQFNIRSIPTLACFKNGKEVERISGALPQQQLKQLIDRLILK